MGREGESFISPDVQAETIGGAAVARGLELVGLESDMDESGGTFDRPGFRRVLERVEAGEASTVIVAKSNRFGRNLRGYLEAEEKIRLAGGELVELDLGIDTTTPTGRLMRDFVVRISQWELEGYTEQWATSTRRAVERGVKVSTYAPFGYSFDDGRRLVPNDDRRLVVELFEMRAGGASWRTLLERFEAATGRRSSRTRMADMIRNRTYLGIVAYGNELENRQAHPAIVDVDLFEAAQRPSSTWRSGDRRRLDNKVKSLLAGIIRCAGCGTGLVRNTTSHGHYRYWCPNTHCAARAGARMEEVDELVVGPGPELGGLVGEWAGARESVDVELGSPAVELERQELDERIGDAELGLEAYVSSPDNFGLEPAVFELGLRARQANIDALRARRDELVVVDEVQDVRTSLARVWPGATVDERRRLLAIVLDAVILRKGPAGRREPVSDRLEVILRGMAPDDPSELER